MKTLGYILLLSLMTNCGARKYEVPVHHLEPKVEAANFSDSLVTTGVDTIITYSDACSGCVQGILNPRYVYWVQNGKDFLTKFTEQANYNIIEPKDFPFHFIARNFDKIKTDSVIVPDFGLMHHDYELLSVKIGEKEFDFQIDEYEKDRNPTNFKVLTIDKIRAALFEIPYWEWHGHNFKTEKQRITVPNKK